MKDKECFVVRTHKYGGPEVQTFELGSVPEPGDGQVRLRQTAAGVNFLDIYHRRGESKPAGGLPFINGFEGVGVIDAVGDGVPHHLKPGLRVGYTLAMGAYATCRLVPATRVVALPPSIDDQTAAAVLLKGTTAEYLLHRLYRVGGGDVVLVHAAAGGVGLLLSQWAKALGATVVGTVGSQAKATIAREQGRCDHVVVMSAPDTDFVTPIRAALGPSPVSVVYDGVAGPTLNGSLDLLRPKGMAVVLGSAGGPAAPINVHALKAKSLVVTSPSLPHFTSDPAEYAASTRAVFGALASGAISVVTRHDYALSDVARARADIEARKTSGSVVLRM